VVDEPGPALAAWEPGKDDFDLYEMDAEKPPLDLPPEDPDLQIVSTGNLEDEREEAELLEAEGLTSPDGDSRNREPSEEGVDDSEDEADGGEFRP
jgi:hypothetical protein